jgi:hypothetical protein
MSRQLTQLENKKAATGLCGTRRVHEINLNMNDKHLVPQAFQEEATKCTPARVYPPAGTGFECIQEIEVRYNMVPM